MKQQLFSKRAAPGDMQSFIDMPVPSTEGRYDIDAGFKKLTRNNNLLNQYLPGSVPAGPIPFGDQPTVNPFEGAMQDVVNADFPKEELAKHRWDRNIQALGFGTVGAGLGGLTASMLSGSADATDEERDRIASSRRRNALIGALLGGGLGYGASKLYREHA